MAKGNFSTREETLRALFSNGNRYFVPKFQRDYSWEEEQWNDLWDDIKWLTENPEQRHFLGFLMLEEVTAKYKIIDGQQRLATFSLMVLAAIRRLQELVSSDNEKRAANLKRDFIGRDDATYLRVERILELNRNNDYDYRHAVGGSDIRRYNVKKTVRTMARAFAYFYDQFAKFDNGQEIAKIIENAAGRLFVMVVDIVDEMTAYQIFENLNARGVKLAPADLVKNYLFLAFDDENNAPPEVLDELDENWDIMSANIGNDNISEFLLTDWNSCYQLTKQRLLFRDIQEKTRIPQAVQTYFDRLTKRSRLYAALLNKNDEFWNGYPQNNELGRLREDLHFLTLFNIRMPLGILMASYDHFKRDFHQVLAWVKVFSLRYDVICKKHPGAQRELYNKICLKVTTGCSLQDVKQELLSEYPSDEEFARAFTDFSIPTEQSLKIPRYLLARMEEKLRLENQRTAEIIDEVGLGLTIEHVLPQRPEEHWEQSFGSNNWQQYRQRFGNMALASQELNEKLGQKAFLAKKPLLMASDYLTTNQTFENYAEWTPAEVEARQKKLAELAVQTWNIR